MTVRCITKSYSNDLRFKRGAPKALDFSYKLTEGKEYLVVALSFLNGSVSFGFGGVYYIVDDYHCLMPIPSILFEIVDPMSSALWLGQELDNNQFILRPKQFLAPFFYDRLSDGDPEATIAFEEALLELDNEEKSRKKRNGMSSE